MNQANTLLAWRLLYYTYILVPLIAGIDKYFDVLADWHIYLNHAIPEMLHISTKTFMYSAGVIEIIIALIVFLRPKIGGYLIALWLVGISVNLISMGTHHHEGYAHAMKHYDVAFRDIAMAVAAWALALLS